jgi:hypothetical protein
MTETGYSRFKVLSHTKIVTPAAENSQRSVNSLLCLGGTDDRHASSVNQSGFRNIAYFTATVTLSVLVESPIFTTTGEASAVPSPAGTCTLIWVSPATAPGTAPANCT